MENGEGVGEEEVEERKKKVERKRGRRRDQPPMKILLLELRKEALNTRQRLKMKVESVVKFSLPRILSWILSSLVILLLYFTN
jgi:molecular chaperone GrpE (heat shock protein)